MQCWRVVRRCRVEASASATAWSYCASACAVMRHTKPPQMCTNTHWNVSLNDSPTTVEHAVAARLHEDLNHHRSTKHGVAPRLAHALTSTVITRNTKTGKRTPAAGRLAGNAAAGAFTQGVLAAGSGASTAGIGLAAEAGANVVREFVPRRHRPPHKMQ